MKSITQTPDAFLESCDISCSKQKEIALKIRNALAKNLGLPLNLIHSLMPPNKLLNIAKKNWNELDFIVDLEENLGIDDTLLIIEKIPRLFSYNFFGITIILGSENIGEWIKNVSDLYVYAYKKRNLQSTETLSNDCSRV
jgi:hypothetical protein